MPNIEARHVGRIDWADGAKAISILLVAFHHAHILAESQDLSFRVFAILDKLLTPIRMPLFFTISGIFANRVLSMPWRIVFRQRIVSYYYLYAAWVVLSWLFNRYVQVDLRHANDEQSIEYLLSMFVVPQGGLWFLWVLALFFGVGRLIDAGRGATLLSLLIVLAVLTNSHIIPLRYPLSNVFLYGPFFYGGAWYGRLIISTVPHYPKIMVCIGAVAYGALMITARWVDPLIGSTLLLSISGLCLALGATVLVCRSNSVQIILSYLGRNTLPIYVMHGKVINLLLTAVLALAWEKGFWIVPAVAFASVAGSLALASLLGAVGYRWLYSVDGPLGAWDSFAAKLRALPAQ